MKKENKNLIFVFVTLVIIILASFAAATYYYEGRYIIKENKEEKEDSPMEIILLAEDTGSAPHKVNFETHVFYQVGNVRYHWNFGDGNTSNETSPTYIYNEGGKYIVNLTVTDSEGRKMSKNITINVFTNRPPKVEMTVSPTIGRRPMAVTFDAEAYDEDGEIVSYEWVVTHPPILMGLYRPSTPVNEEDFTKTFWRTGDYDVRLTVEDDSGNKVTQNVRIKCERSMFETIINAPIDIYKMLQRYDTKLRQNVEFAISNGLWEKLYTKFQDSGKDSMVTLMDNLLSYLEIKWSPGSEINDPPIAPNTPSPKDNVTGIDINANVSWNCSDPDDDPITYDVYFGTTSVPSLVSDDQTATIFDPGTLESDTKYYWRVAASDGRGGLNSSQVWSFKTE